MEPKGDSSDNQSDRPINGESSSREDGIKKRERNLIPVTSQNARQIAQIGHEKRRNTAREGMLAGVQAAIDRFGETGKIPSSRVATSDDAWQFLVAKITEKIIESKSMQGMTEATKWLGQITGYTPDAKKEEYSQQNGPVVSLAGANFILQVSKYAQERIQIEENELDAMEAEIIDLEPG